MLKVSKIRRPEAILPLGMFRGEVANHPRTNTKGKGKACKRQNPDRRPRGQEEMKKERKIVSDINPLRKRATYPQSEKKKKQATPR